MRPSISDEPELSSYIIEDVLKGAAEELGWTTQDKVQPIINATLRYLRVTDFMDVDDDYLIELVARVQTWFAVVEETTLDYDSSEADASLSRSKMHEQALKTYELSLGVLNGYENTLPQVVLSTTLRSRSATIRPTW